MYNKSVTANPNYLAKIVALPEPRKHSNADKLLCWNIDFQNVITNLDYRAGDLVVYFPVESAINKDLIFFFNGFEDKTLNADPLQKGFFNKHGRVRAITLRQTEKSQGFILPIGVVEAWLMLQPGYTAPKLFSDDLIGLEFDSYGDIEICKKYVPKNSRTPGTPGLKSDRKKVRISRLVENQFRLHNDTDNLRRNADKIKPDDMIGIHYKKHGTSWVVGKVLTKKKLNWYEKLLVKFGVNIVTEEYGPVYSSRKVVKNEYETQESNHYYGYDLWADIKDQVIDKIPNGYTLYGEYIGFDKNGKMIQKDFDYGCKENEGKIYVYRITVTNTAGQVLELDDMQIKQFCEKAGLLYADTFIYYGKAKSYFDWPAFYGEAMLSEVNVSQWQERFVKALEEIHNEKDCYMCVNVVPEEGIIVRVQDAFDYKAYKLKSGRFLEKETKDLDAGVVDIETEESQPEEENYEAAA